MELCLFQSILHSQNGFVIVFMCGSESLVGLTSSFICYMCRLIWFSSHTLFEEPQLVCQRWLNGIYQSILCPLLELGEMMQGLSDSLWLWYVPVIPHHPFSLLQIWDLKFQMKNTLLSSADLSIGPLHFSLVYVAVSFHTLLYSLTLWVCTDPVKSRACVEISSQIFKNNYSKKGVNKIENKKNRE